MEIKYRIGAAAGIVVLFFSVPLGDWYGHIYLMLIGGMETERYLMLTQSAVSGFQMIGGVISLLSGAAGIFFGRGKARGGGKKEMQSGGIPGQEYRAAGGEKREP